MWRRVGGGNSGKRTCKHGWWPSFPTKHAEDSTVENGSLEHGDVCISSVKKASHWVKPKSWVVEDLRKAPRRR